MRRIPRKAFSDAYGRMQVRMCEQIEKDGKSINFFERPQEERFKFIYSLVMSLTTLEREPATNLSGAMIEFEAYSFMMELLGTLTPIEFERMFPIIKEYDGERWGMKDYFYCKNKLNALPQDEPIFKNKKMFDFLWGYHNNDICFLMVEYMGVMDDVRKFNGELPMLQEFAQNNGIFTYQKFIDENGKEYRKNNDTGEIVRVRKPLPEYLKVVK